MKKLYLLQISDPLNRVSVCADTGPADHIVHLWWKSWDQKRISWVTVKIRLVRIMSLCGVLVSSISTLQFRVLPFLHWIANKVRTYCQHGLLEGVNWFRISFLSKSFKITWCLSHRPASFVSFCLVNLFLSVCPSELCLPPTLFLPF